MFNTFNFYINLLILFTMQGKQTTKTEFVKIGYKETFKKINLTNKKYLNVVFQLFGSVVIFYYKDKNDHKIPIIKQQDWETSLLQNQTKKYWIQNKIQDETEKQSLNITNVYSLTYAQENSQVDLPINQQTFYANKQKEISKMNNQEIERMKNTKIQKLMSLSQDQAKKILQQKKQEIRQQMKVFEKQQQKKSKSLIQQALKRINLNFGLGVNKYIHKGYTCSVCNQKDFSGFRYQCDACEFNICEKCQFQRKHQTDSNHDKKHSFIKIKDDIQANFKKQNDLIKQNAIYDTINQKVEIKKIKQNKKKNNFAQKQQIFLSVVPDKVTFNKLFNQFPDKDANFLLQKYFAQN